MLHLNLCTFPVFIGGYEVMESQETFGSIQGLWAADSGGG